MAAEDCGILDDGKEEAASVEAADDSRDEVAEVEDTFSVEDKSTAVDAVVVTSSAHSCIVTPPSASWKQYSSEFFK